MAVSDGELIARAQQVRERAYAIYSGYRVGAALVDEDDRIHVGCNVENASYPEGTCAESNAIAAMVAAGGHRIAAIAIVGGKDGLERCTPCGGCRQRILQFAGGETAVISLDSSGKSQRQSIYELLPAAFQFQPGG